MSASGPCIPPNEEITQMINALIDNQQIKDILMKSISNTSVESGSKTFKTATIKDKHKDCRANRR